jgi:hypothetical protein
MKIGFQVPVTGQSLIEIKLSLKKFFSNNPVADSVRIYHH